MSHGNDCRTEMIVALIGSRTNWLSHKMVVAPDGCRTYWYSHELVVVRTGSRTNWLSQGIGSRTELVVARNWLSHAMVFAL